MLRDYCPEKTSGRMRLSVKATLFTKMDIIFSLLSRG